MNGDISDMRDTEKQGIIRPAHSISDFDAVRKLCWAYRDVLLDRTAHCPGLLDHYYATPVYQKLMDDLPGRHAAPDGEVFVAVENDQITACGMTHRIDAETCEIKRVFVAPARRGKGVAKSLCTSAMRWAKGAGYKRMVLDTMIGLTEAIALYENMGFERTSAYHDLPDEFVDLVVFYEHTL